MRWSIRSQILVPLLTLLLGVVGISTWTAFTSANRAREQIEAQVRNVARTLSESDFPLTRRVLEQMKGLSGAEYLLVRRQGSRLATFPSEAAVLPLPENLSEDWRTLDLGEPVRVGGETFFCTGLRLPQPRPNAGDDLYIFYPEALWRDALWQAVRPSLVLGVFVGAASLVLAAGVAQRLSRRIRELERRTRLIAAGDFSPMLLPGRNDELRDLGGSINDMARRLAQLQDAVQKNERLRLLGQVGGGLAHQLRNGVTGARLAVQLHARECNGAVDREPLDVALRQLALVESSLKRFLDLGSTGGFRAEPCSLGDIIEEAVVLLRPQCRHAHIDLVWTRPAGPPAIEGDASQLQHLLLNVIGNAIEAAGPGGKVKVGLCPTAGGDVRIEVADSGPGPPAEVAQRLFEPFVTGKRDGVGLGLAVARQVVEVHGGKIGWRRDANETCFWIQLPASRREPAKEELS